MNSKIKLLITVLVLALFIIVATMAYNSLGKDVEPNTNINTAPAQSKVSQEETETQPAPDFTVLDMEGNSVSFSTLVGKPIVLNFWASWCSPCKSEMSEFNKVYEDMGDDVIFIMVNLTDGQRETVETASSYIEEQGFTFPVYFDTEQDAAYTYGIRSIPTTVFINADGNIVTGVQGAITEKKLLQKITLIK